MAEPAAAGEFRTLTTSRGTIAARLSGPAAGPLALLVHGLSANHVAFGPIGERLARDGWRVAALDLRGRGASPDTGPGTYGLETHAADCVEIAAALGHDRFVYIGWSLGALIGITLAARQPGHIDRLVLVDHAGDEDDAAVEAVRRGLGRLDAVVAAPADYSAQLRALGAVQPWEPLWERYYEYELEQFDGGWRARTSRQAATEDLDLLEDGGMHELWSALTMPVLLIRALVPLNGGLIVPGAELARFRAAVPHLRVLDLERNHFGVMTHPDAIEAIGGFLSE